MNIQPLKTKLFKENDDLITFIRSEVKRIPEKSVLVITSKIVALSEGRTVPLGTPKDRERLIRKESELAIKTKYTWLTIKDGMVMASAGIDESNADGRIVLLPKNSFKSAAHIRSRLKKIYKVKNLGILITDSRIFPLRSGVVGVALGYAGFKGIRDYRDTPDIFGRILKMSRTDVADSLATAAVLEMGEGREQQPLALITHATIDFTEKINSRELLIDIKEDLYQPLFEKIKKLKR